MPTSTALALLVATSFVGFLAFLRLQNPRYAHFVERLVSAHARVIVSVIRPSNAVSRSSEVHL